MPSVFVQTLLALADARNQVLDSIFVNREKVYANKVRAMAYYSFKLRSMFAAIMPAGEAATHINREVITKMLDASDAAIELWVRSVVWLHEEVASRTRRSLDGRYLQEWVLSDIIKIERYYMGNILGRSATRSTVGHPYPDQLSRSVAQRAQTLSEHLDKTLRVFDDTLLKEAIRGASNSLEVYIAAAKWDSNRQSLMRSRRAHEFFFEADRQPGMLSPEYGQILARRYSSGASMPASK